MPHSDIVIVGSGLAALTVAYHVCESMSVTIITKGSITDGNSYMAQGGVAAVMNAGDSWESHMEDTLQAGAFHNSIDAVEQLVKSGQKEIQELIENGVDFDKDPSRKLLLGKEGAHKHHRIVHAGGDATGKAIMLFLIQKLKNKVTFIEHTMAVHLLKKYGDCIGVIGKDAAGKLAYYTASHTVLATGGCGALFKHTSNHSSLTGDGIGLAYRAGAELADLEFVQFHPTMLSAEGKAAGLISEAVRGEGAVLQNEAGERIMNNVHPYKDLAPRDIVAREIFRRNQRGETVFLNINPVKNFTNRFPTISAMCRKYCIDLEKGLIPVVPGMHFLMGGIVTALNGETAVPHLYAVGEAACTGVHGANRLASNSLLEGLVFGKKLAVHLKSRPIGKKEHPEELAYTDQFLQELPSKREIQSVVTAFLGIERNGPGLKNAYEWFNHFQLKIFSYEKFVKNSTIEQLEILNLLTAGLLISRSALLRIESRGGHYRRDFPEQEESLRGQQIRQSLEGTKIERPHSGVIK
ncbi:L-aspartate oxidase [Metabacillus sp. RGM 3146]|uniref:L-aspartate oxidase n=1 Tax=Metabacillus sp. RGM 3146 TaxID=3401092 RepID=UPI003B9BAB45